MTDTDLIQGQLKLVKWWFEDRESTFCEKRDESLDDCDDMLPVSSNPDHSEATHVAISYPLKSIATNMR
jgi:hypothetical protein